MPNQRNLTRALILVACLAVAGPGMLPPAGAQTPASVTEPVRDAIGWLSERLQQAGIDVPERFDLASALQLVLQVLGVTMDRLDNLREARIEDLRQAQADLFGAWDNLKEQLNASAGSAGGVVEAAFKRLIGLILVETRGKVTFADGNPAPNVLVVQFSGYEEGLATGQPGVSAPVPIGYAVTDAAGNYRLLHAGGLLAAARFATGTAGAGAMGPYVVHPVELLPAQPPYRLITYDAQGQPSVSAGQQPLAVWQVLGL